KCQRHAHTRITAGSWLSAFPTGSRSRSTGARAAEPSSWRSSTTRQTRFSRSPCRPTGRSTPSTTPTPTPPTTACSSRICFRRPPRPRPAISPMRPQAPPRTFKTMNNDTLQAYLQEIGRYPLLTRAEEVQLAKRIEAGDDCARRRMTESNLRLVVTIAKGYQGRGVDLLDLIQEGTVGLMRAVDRYDWRRDVKFSTYAAWWIRHGIAQALLSARPIRVPDSVLDRANAVRAAERELAAKLGREASASELAGALDLTSEQVDEARAALQPVSSLEEPTAGEDTHRIQLLADPNATDPAEAVAEEPRERELEKRLARLPGRGRRVIELRFGLVDGVAHTADAVAATLGVTRERVRQIELHALGKLSAPKTDELPLAA